MDELNLDLELDYDEEQHPDEPTMEKAVSKPRIEAPAPNQAPRIKFPAVREAIQAPPSALPAKNLEDYRIPKKRPDRSRSPISKPREEPVEPRRNNTQSRREPRPRQESQQASLVRHGMLLVTNTTETGLEWHRPCNRIGKHSLCRGTTVEDVLRAANCRRAPPATIAQQPCPTILHGIIARWAFHQPNWAEAVGFVATIMQVPADRLGIFYETNEQRFLKCPGSHLLNNKDTMATMELWVQNCSVARATVQVEPWAPIKSQLLTPPTRFNETQDIFERIATGWYWQ
uniref:Uncharacterized protein n=1 Tax=Ditylenchus dipsaci TaxID=166011 RepID=A0A915CUN8_9BILA